MTSKIAKAHASLAHAAGLSAEALKAVSRDDGEAAAKLLEEAKKALDEAKVASSEIWREGRANDD
jgi:cellobiose-specific phosphotransferase system component IIA